MGVTLWALLRRMVHLLWHIARLDFHAAITLSDAIRLSSTWRPSLHLDVPISYRYIGCSCGRCFLQRPLTQRETQLIVALTSSFRRRSQNHASE